MKSRRTNGFTLVEVLVTMTIIVVLALIGGASFHSIRSKAKATTEVNAARQLIAAYLGYAAEHSGALLPGYKSDPETRNLDGELLYNPVNARYPWRLAPHAPRLAGVFLTNGNEAMLDKPNCDYLVSVEPNLGLNDIFAGGHFGSGSPLRPSPRLVDVLGKFYVSHLAEIETPENMIIFASARHGVKSKDVGHFEVHPPNLLAPSWSTKPASDAKSAADHGFVDFRWGGSAVVAMAGGNVLMLDETRLRDMRRWSNQAARANDPDFTVKARDPQED